MPATYSSSSVAKLVTSTVLAMILFPGSFPAADIAEAERTRQEGLDFFENNVRPLLIQRCYECHSAGARKLKGGLRLDFRDGLLKGGNSGAAIVPGKPDQSLLIKAVRYRDETLQMPPRDPLSSAQIALLEQWIKMGAPDPRVVATTSSEAALEKKVSRDFWSFRPRRASAPPQVRKREWPRNEIDRFILAKLETSGLSPAPDASKQVLIRRATFDLTGLPPTPLETENFLRDKSANAFEKLIDRLLAAPQYGERWGRHWLDVARYADTSGCNSDFPVTTAYKYRNYVIESFNRDKPYDQFIREQIAGDLLSSSTEQQKFEQIIATGYLAIARRFGSRANEFHLTIEDIIDNMGKGILGLSVGCARCHDHKFDPIPTRDYYALYGIFNSTQYAFPGTEIYRHPKDFVPLTTGTNVEALFRYQREIADLDDSIEKLQEQMRSLEREQAGTAGASKSPEHTESRSDDFPERLAKVKKELEEAKNRQRQLEANPPSTELAYAVNDGKPANARIQKKGDPKNPGDEVPRGFLEVLGGDCLPQSEAGSGRLQLAAWLTRPQNPLTARVMVNRIWQHHFGRGLVQTPNDFGARGSPPTHPELLDYLAERFVQSGWSIKALHRLIMLSRVYQLDSAALEPAPPPPVFSPKSEQVRTQSHRGKHVSVDRLALDPSNNLLRHFNRRRLDAEEIRDAMLAVSGALDLSTGGAHPFPPQAEWRYTQHKPFVAVYESHRRSVYLMQQRIKKQPFLELFDGADTNTSVGQRPVSTTPLQALFLMNDPFVHEQADTFAARILLARAQEPERIQFAYQLALGRPANAAEVREAKDFIAQCRLALQQTDLEPEKQLRSAWASFCRVLLSSNEFLFVE